MKKYIALLLLSLVFASCAKDLVTGKSTMNYYSLHKDVKLGRQVLTAQTAELKKKGVPMDEAADPEEFARIERIVADITPGTHYPDFPYEVHLAKLDDVVNAWCAPGGKIMVYTGLWNARNGLVEKGNDAQLAAVLSHEIAHANARHVTESISRNMTIALVGVAAQSAIQLGGSTSGANLFGEVFSSGMNIYVPSYSRTNEFEADKLGLFYMAKAGYDPGEAVKLWKKAAEARKDKTSIYASHPASGERAKALEKLLPEAMELYHKSKAGD